MVYLWNADVLKGYMEQAKDQKGPIGGKKKGEKGKKKKIQVVWSPGGHCLWSLGWEELWLAAGDPPLNARTAPSACQSQQ